MLPERLDHRHGGPDDAVVGPHPVLQGQPDRRVRDFDGRVSISGSLERRPGRRYSPEGATTMRFMVMHKVDANMEAGGPPPPGIIQGMGKLVGESLKSGVF